jgi:hypothetical protein
MTNELEARAKKFEQQAKTFKAFQKVLAAKGDFKDLQQATICAGLAEVCQMLAEAAREMKRRG